MPIAFEGVTRTCPLQLEYYADSIDLDQMLPFASAIGQSDLAPNNKDGLLAIMLKRAFFHDVAASARIALTIKDPAKRSEIMEMIHVYVARSKPESLEVVNRSMNDSTTK